MTTWSVFDHNGVRPVFVGSVTAPSYDDALGLACDYWPGQVASVEEKTPFAL